MLPGVPSMATKVGETVENIVTQVREKTILPAERAARAIGLVLLICVVTAGLLVLLTIAAIRGLTILTDVVTGEPRVWMAYLVLAVVFLLIGSLLWSKRKPR